MTDLSSPEMYSSARVKAALPVKVVPDGEKWRLGLIAGFRKMKADKHLRVAVSNREGQKSEK